MTDKMTDDEMLLMLTNNQKLYQKFVAAVKVLIEKTKYAHLGAEYTRAPYDEFRKVVYDACKTIVPSWSRLNRVSTTVLTQDIFCHYYEEASGELYDHTVQKRFRHISPDYVNQDFAKVESDKTKTNCINNVSSTMQNPANWPKPTKGIEMNETINTQELITTRTYIKGVEASQVSDEKIFGMISNYEAEIENLNKIKNQPKALKTKVAALQKQIDDLVSFVDARTEKAA